MFQEIQGDGTVRQNMLHEMKVQLKPTELYCSSSVGCALNLLAFLSNLGDHVTLLPEKYTRVMQMHPSDPDWSH